MLTSAVNFSCHVKLLEVSSAFLNEVLGRTTHFELPAKKRREHGDYYCLTIKKSWYETPAAELAWVKALRKVLKENGLMHYQVKQLVSRKFQMQMKKN